MKTIRKSIMALLLSGLIVLSSCSGDKDKKAAAQGAAGAQQAIPLPVKVLTMQTAVIENDYPASIKGEEDIEIRPMLEGFIKTINVDEGTIVRKGQVLFTLDMPQYQQNVLSAEAAIKTATADVNNAQMEVTKLTPLVEKGIISKYQLEAANYALQAKRAVLNQVQTSLANAKTNLSYTVITSPVSGIVGSIPYRLGSLVGSANALTTVANTSNVYVYFSLNEKQLLELLRTTPGTDQNEKIRRLAPVNLILSDGTEYSEAGRIETINGIINSSTGAATLRATFPNPQGIVRSGSTGSVRIKTVINNSIVVPQKATYEIQGNTFIYVVDNNNKVKQEVIKITALSDGQNYLVNEGLKVNDKVVVDGVSTLKDGMLIKPQL